MPKIKALEKVKNSNYSDNFIFGNACDMVLGKLKKELPFCHVSIFGSFNSMKNLGLKITQILRTNGFKVSLFVTNDKDQLNVESVSGYFNMEENVRALIALDESSHFLCDYLSSIFSTLLIKVIHSELPICFFPRKLVVKVDNEYTLFTPSDKSYIMIDEQLCNLSFKHLESVFLKHLINSIDQAIYLTRDSVQNLSLLDKIISNYDNLTKEQMISYLIVLGILHNDYHLSTLTAFDILTKNQSDITSNVEVILRYIINVKNKDCDYNQKASKISSLLCLKTQSVLKGLKNQVEFVKSLNKDVCFDRIRKRSAIVHDFLSKKDYLNVNQDKNLAIDLDLIGDLPFSFNAFSVIRECV